MFRSLALIAALLTSTFAAADGCRRMFAVSDPIITSMQVTSAAYGDFNEDGRVDVALMLGDQRIIALNRGPLFEPMPRESISGFPSVPFTAPIVAATDVNGDGHLDLVYGVYGTSFGAASAFWVAFGRGDGTFQPVVERDVPAPAGDSLQTVDFNRDGRLDFVYMTLRTAEFTFVKSNGDGTFSPAAHVTMPTSPFTQAGQMAVGDFDGDGNIDVFRQEGAITSAQQSVTFGWNDGAFHFTNTVESMTDLPLLTALDVDGDGVDELVALQDGNLVIGRARDHHLTVQRIPVAAPGLSQSFDYAVAVDVDHDGIRDIVFRTSGGLGVLRGTPGGFASAEYYALPGAGGLTAVDLNGDGYLDFAPSVSVDGLRVLDGASLAAGHANANRLYPAPFYAGAATLADVDGDGVRDLVLTSDPFDGATPFGAAVSFGNGHGLFPRTAKSFGLSGGAVSFIGDFDGDGRADLAVSPAAATGPRLIAFGSSDGFGPSTLALDVDRIAGSAVLGSSSAPALVALKGSDVQLITISAGRLSTATTLTHVTGYPAITIVRTPPGSAAQIVVADSNGVRLLTRTSDGWNERSFPAWINRGGIAAADLNDDGRLDFVTPGVPSYVMFSQSDGTYQQQYLPPIIWGNADTVTPADFDGDGWLDVVATSRGNWGDPGYAQVLRNHGDGTFEPYASALTSAPYRQSVVVDDIDGDGFPDLVIAAFGGAEVMLNTCASPRLKVVAAAAGQRVKFVIHALSASGSFVGGITISEHGVVLANPEAWRAYDLATSVWMSPVLAVGIHTFQITYQEEYAPPSTVSVDVDVTPVSPRRRAVHH